MPTSKTLTLDFDDLHYREPESCLSAIKYLVDRVPNIKLSFFTIAALDGMALYEDYEWCAEIKKFIDSGNVVLGVHGLRHSFLEFKEISKDGVIFKLDFAKRIFDRAGLPFVKVFKGPNWGINQNTYDVLKQEGYQGVYSHNEYSQLTKDNLDLKTTIYNWNVGEEFISSQEKAIFGHGHSWNVCGNGIDETKDRIIKVCEEFNPTFKFIHE